AHPSISHEPPSGLLAARAVRLTCRTHHDRTVRAERSIARDAPHLDFIGVTLQAVLAHFLAVVEPPGHRLQLQVGATSCRRFHGFGTLVRSTATGAEHAPPAPSAVEMLELLQPILLHCIRIDHAPANDDFLDDALVLVDRARVARAVGLSDLAVEALLLDAVDAVVAVGEAVADVTCARGADVLLDVAAVLVGPALARPRFEAPPVAAEVGGVVADLAALAAGSDGRQWHGHVAATVVEVDFEHHDLATRRIDQQILDLAHFATVQRAHFPTTDVRLARCDAVILQLIDRVQSPAELGVGADTGCVAPDPFVPRHRLPPRR